MKLNEREYHVFISNIIFKMATSARISSLAARALDQLLDGFCNIPEGKTFYETDHMDNDGFAKDVFNALTDDFAKFVRGLDNMHVVSRMANRKIISEHQKALKDIQRIKSLYGAKNVQRLRSTYGKQ